MNSGGRKSLRCLRRAVLILAVVMFIPAVSPRPAQAQCSYCLCSIAIAATTTAYLEAVMQWLINVVFNFDDDGLDPPTVLCQVDPGSWPANWRAHVKCFIIENFFKRHVEMAMEHMTQQLTQAAMLQMNLIGAFFDSQEQMERQLLFQQLAARAHKDYHSSAGLCAMGTAAEGLDAAYRNGEFIAAVMARRSLNRQLHNPGVSGTAGPDSDMDSRLETFKRQHCEPSDNDYTGPGGGDNQGLRPMCGDGGPNDRVNRDVDYADFSRILTIDADFRAAAEPGNMDILALANNLYAHRPFDPIPESLLTAEGNRPLVLDIRSVVAKRAVAEHSFHSIAGMKAEGSANSDNKGSYMGAALIQLGMPDAQAARAYLGERPSYDAQMEFLTKTLYQNPTFYLDLYDKPVNVARKGAAIRAIGLIQSMDIYKSQLRAEAALSVLLELEVERHQKEIENTRQKQRSSGATMSR